MLFCFNCPCGMQAGARDEDVGKEVCCPACRTLLRLRLRDPCPPLPLSARARRCAALEDGADACRSSADRVSVEGHGHDRQPGVAARESSPPDPRTCEDYRSRPRLAKAFAKA